jgi:hypothetical protein
MFSTAFSTINSMHYLSMPERIDGLAASSLLASAFPALRGTARGMPVVPPSFHHSASFNSMSAAACNMHPMALHRSASPIPPSGSRVLSAETPAQKANVDKRELHRLLADAARLLSDCPDLRFEGAFPELVEQLRHFLLLHSCFPSRHRM